MKEPEKPALREGSGKVKTRLKKKKITYICRFCRLCTAVFLLCLFAVGAMAHRADAKDTVHVVTTIFPLWDWTRNITEGAENVELTWLQDNGADLHSFQADAQDMLTISSCDVFVLVGGESDKWTGDVLKSASSDGRQVLTLLDAADTVRLEEEEAEGMQPEEAEEEGESYDEHIWLSVRNARAACRAIADALCAADPGQEELYRKNAKAYDESLAALDEAYQKAVSDSPGDTLLFADRFPFLYMIRDYSLKYYAAFSGCSAETEASFETVAFLIDKVNEESLSCVVVLEGSDQKLADTIIQNSASKDQQIVVMNAMQNVTKEDVQEGMTYLSAMEDNLEALKQALS